jgi:DNA-binding protein HU-beta
MADLNKSTLVQQVSEKTGYTQDPVKQIINATLAVMSETLAEHGSVRLIGFGSFSVKHRAARMGRNPKTGEDMQISASDYPVFSAGKSLKAMVNKSS